MNELLERDQELRPELFSWNGAVSRARLEAWLAERQLEVPDDLAEFWEKTGGGDLFESETIFGPFGEADSGDDVDSVNDTHRSRGLGHEYLVIHDGSALTGIRRRDKKWVVLDRNSYLELNEYDSFEQWYSLVLRAEFAARYGLPPR